jgi:hypothetical protein
MSSLDSRRPNAGRRLQVVLLLFALGDLLALPAGLSFGGPLYGASGDRLDGLLATRGSLSGMALVPLGLYIYAIARMPSRDGRCATRSSFGPAGLSWRPVRCSRSTTPPSTMSRSAAPSCRWS